MKSRVFLEERVENREHRFGQGAEYYPTIVEAADGTSRPALFTAAAVEEACSRGEANAEDFPPRWDRRRLGFWRRVRRLFHLR